MDVYRSREAGLFDKPLDWWLGFYRLVHEQQMKNEPAAHRSDGAP